MRTANQKSIFFSYARPDQAVARRLVDWLKLAGIGVWVDWESSPAGAILGTALPEASNECRAVVRVLSRQSDDGKLGKQEECFGLAASIYESDRPLIPIWVEQEAPQRREIPHFIANFAVIHAPGGELDSEGALAILKALNPQGQRVAKFSSLDIYISRPWRHAGRDPAECEMADKICRTLCDLGVRPIGDAEDQARYSTERVRSLIESCNGLLAVVPDRGNGRTSKYFEQEVRIARDAHIPYVLATNGNPDFPEELVTASVLGRFVSEEKLESADICELLDGAYGVMPKKHYLFLASPFRSTERDCWLRARNLAEWITGVECRVGDEFEQPEAIVNVIRNAQAVIADISFESDYLATLEHSEPRGPNSLIEAGIAMGSQRHLHLLNSTPRRKSPFMFRTTTQSKYTSHVELLAVVHAVASQYRRRVLC